MQPDSSFNPDLIFLLLSFSLIMATVAASILAAASLARSRGRRRHKWMTLAALFGPLALLALLVLPKRRSDY